MVRSLICLLVCVSSASAAPAVLTYPTQERRLGTAFPSTMPLELSPAEVVGELLNGEVEFLSSWFVTLNKNEIGRTFTLTAADPAFAGFAEAAPWLLTTHKYQMFMFTYVDGVVYRGNGELWPHPIGFRPQSTLPGFQLSRVEVQLVEYFTSPIGSVVQWDTRLIGVVPEPASWLMLLCCCLHLVRRRR